MRYFVLVFSFCFLLSACGGSGGIGGSGSAMPPPLPNGSISGVAHDGVLNGSTITVRSYTTGAVLGTTTTNEAGNYSVTVQTEEATLIIEATGGIYVEEASGTSENLTDGQKLRAVISNYNFAGKITASITPFTNLAAGLAAYRSRQGMSAAAAISSANQDVSTMLGFDIINTVPRDITNIANATAFTSNEYSYGFACAAISSWTMYASEKNGELKPAKFNAISFAQLMYNDISADGVLDGMGFDANGQLTNLSFGQVLIDQNTYRYALAAHMIQMANSPNNKTNLTETQILPFASAYAGSSSAIFGGATALPFLNSGRPSVVITSPAPGATLIGMVSVTASASSQGTIDSATLKLDQLSNGGTPVTALAPNPNAPTFSINIDQANPNPNSLTVTVIDSFGVSSSSTMAIHVFKSPPVVTVLYMPRGYNDSLDISGSFTNRADSSMKTMTMYYNGGSGSLQCSFTQTSSTGGTWGCPTSTVWGYGFYPNFYLGATNNDGYTCTSTGLYPWGGDGSVICQ